LIAQFNEFPSSFKTYNSIQTAVGQTRLCWQPSLAKNGKPLTYTLRYGEHFLLPDSVSTVVENLTDTLFSVENLKAGKTYYWRVSAHTGDLKTDAFNTKNVIYSREGTTLSGTVSNILKLTREDSPYLI